MAMAAAAAAAAGAGVVVLNGTWSQSQVVHGAGSLFFTGDRWRRNPLRLSLGISWNRRRSNVIEVKAAASKKQTFSSLDELLQLSDKPVLVDFYATWCGPCQFMAPVLNQVSISMSDTIQVVKIDTEKYPQIADKFNIAALPTFILFKHGKPIDRFEGALTAEQLMERIQATLKLDA